MKRIVNLLLFVAVAVAFMALPASAAVYTAQTATTGEWVDWDNADWGGTPGAGDFAIIDGGRWIEIDKTLSIGSTRPQGANSKLGIRSNAAVTTQYDIIVGLGENDTNTVEQTGGSLNLISGAGVLHMGYTTGTTNNGNATYNLSGGTLTTGDVRLGVVGRESTFNQSGGTHSTSVLWVGKETSSGNTKASTYSLTGGTLNLNSGNMVVGSVGGSIGVFKMGNETQTGTMSGGNDLNLGFNTAAALATFQGWGVSSMPGRLLMGGSVIADGWGGSNTSDRTLDLSNFSSLLNVDSTNRSDSGWYAQNQGILKLPGIESIGADDTVCWGDVDDASSNQDLINSVKMAFTGVTGGDISGSLLAMDTTLADNAGINIADQAVIGVWDMDGSSFDFGTGNGQMTFLYDAVLASTYGIDEADLKVFHYSGGEWTDITNSIDTDTNMITTNSIDSFSMFAVGTAVPEPTTLCLLALGGLGFLRRRK